MKYLLGTDTGSTTCKAALFDINGRQIACASRKMNVMSRHPGWREVDPEGVWRAAAETIAEVITLAGVNARDIAALGTSGAGDGGYFLDAQGQPVRPAIQSSDSRAVSIADELKKSSAGDQVFAISGVSPFPGETTSMATWIKRNEPQAYRRIAHVAVTKDYVKYRLTGIFNSDVTDAVSAGFVDQQRLAYSKELLDLCGLPELWDALPPFTASWDVVGRVTPEAAALTGLLPGTPVVSGIHDVSACALGSGAITPGAVVVIAGTWNINLAITAELLRNPQMFCSRFAIPGLYVAAVIGATSAANLEWFVTHCCGDEKAEAKARGISVYDVCNELVATLPPGSVDIIYHPFLHIHGGGLSESARAGFYGISGWHTKAHLLRAVYEGVVYSHLDAIKGLCSFGFDMRTARLAGGAAHSAVWSQMFADALEVPIEICEAAEVGAHGAALCAGIGAGIYSDATDAVTKAVRIERRHEPHAEDTSHYLSRYAEYKHLVDVMQEPWNRLAQLSNR